VKSTKLQVTVVPAGFGTLVLPTGEECSDTCSYVVSDLTKPITVVRDPLQGRDAPFPKWTGCEPASASSCRVADTATGEAKVTATFPSGTLELTVASGITVTLDRSNDKCSGNDCRARSMPPGRHVLRGTPANNLEWVGCTHGWTRDGGCSIEIKSGATAAVWAGVVEPGYWETLSTSTSGVFFWAGVVALIVGALGVLYLWLAPGRQDEQRGHGYGQKQIERHAHRTEGASDSLPQERTQDVRSDLPPYLLPRRTDSDAIEDLRAELDKLEKRVAALGSQDDVADGRTTAHALSPRSGRLEKEAAMLGVVNAAWDALAMRNEKISRDLLRHRLESLGVQGDLFFSIRDFQKHVDNLRKIPFDFEPNASGGWLLVDAEDGSVLGVPIDHSAFTGKILSVLREMFEGWDKNPEQPRFHAAYRACRFRPTDASRRTLQVSDRGLLVLEGVEPAPPPSGPAPYVSLQALPASETSRPALAVVGQRLNQLHETVVALENRIGRLAQAASPRATGPLAPDPRIERLRNDLDDLVQRVAAQTTTGSPAQKEYDELRDAVGSLHQSVTALREEVKSLQESTSVRSRAATRPRPAKPPVADDTADTPVVAEASAVWNVKESDERIALNTQVSDAPAVSGEKGPEESIVSMATTSQEPVVSNEARPAIGPALVSWLDRWAETVGAPTGDDSTPAAYAANLDAAVVALKGFAAADRSDATIAVAHLSSEKDETLGIERLTSATAHCAACEGLGKTVVHFGIAESGSRVAVFLPPRTVIRTEWMLPLISRRMLDTENAAKAALNVWTVERPAALVQVQAEPAPRYRLDETLRLRVLPSS
jgi:hypothetical protein